MELKKSFYYPFQRAGGTPTVPWGVAYQPSMAFYKIYHSSVLSLDGILLTKLDLNYQKKSRENTRSRVPGAGKQKNFIHKIFLLLAGRALLFYSLLSLPPSLSPSYFFLL